MICFNQFFLGLVPNRYDKEIIGELVRAASSNSIAVVTGNLVINERDNEVSCAFIDSNGKLQAYGMETTSKATEQAISRMFDTALGPMMVLSGLEAYDSAVDSLIQEIKPKVILMQTSAVSLLELEAIKELAIERSHNQAHLILVTSIVGEFADQRFLGGTMAIMQGEIVDEVPNDTEGLLAVDIDPLHFVDYRILREPVTIPELLRQKLIHDSSIRESSESMEA